jgi:Zn-dependent M28 family amino/carboxypeptidase
VAIVAPDGRENYGTVMVNEVRGKAWIDPSAIHPPFLVLAAEHYNRIMRIVEKKIPVEMKADIRIAIDNQNRTDYNVIAEIPGSDLAHEVVMLGAHLDANSAGQGATDNASGCAVVMEAMRILKAIGIKPRRTIRAALWGGEEYGLLGSRGYVKEHFGDPKSQTYKPHHADLSAYFNMDGGTGKFRGIYLQGNERARPIFQEWMKAFYNLGMTHISNRVSFNSDHSSFLAVGLPGFSFIQDPIERRAYHTNMDTFDRLVEEDLIQASIVMAGFVYQAAMNDTKIPRVAPIYRER